MSLAKICSLKLSSFHILFKIKNYCQKKHCKNAIFFKSDFHIFVKFGNFAEISPIEHAIMWIGVYEMQHCLDVPWRVVLNECIDLAKDFGGTDGHKYVNAVLGGLAPELRSAEVQADRQSGRAK
jgi:hypothetical protein